MLVKIKKWFLGSSHWSFFPQVDGSKVYTGKEIGWRIPNLLISFLCALLLGFMIAVALRSDKKPVGPKISKPGSGVEYRRSELNGSPVHVAKVDLRRVKPRVLLPSRGKTHQTLSELIDCQPQAVVGINGPLFTPKGEVVGLLVKDGEKIKSIPEEQFKIDLTQIGFRTATATIENSELSQGYQEVISGGPCLIKNGERRKFERGNEFMTSKHSRTAVGLIDSHTIVCVVIEDATGQELAEVLLELGVTDAINLDGGSSSTMIIRGKDGMEVVNGGSRPIAAGLAFCER